MVPVSNPELSHSRCRLDMRQSYTVVTSSSVKGTYILSEGHHYSLHRRSCNDQRN